MYTRFQAFCESVQVLDYVHLFGKRVDDAMTFREKHIGGFSVAPVEVGGYLEKELAPGKVHTKLIITMNNGRTRYDNVVAEVLDDNGKSRTQIVINGKLVYDRTGQNHELDELIDVLRYNYLLYLERIRVRVQAN